MYWRIKAENLYRTSTTTTIAPISSADPMEEFSFWVHTPPKNDSWWIIINFSDSNNRDLIFFHRRSWNTLYYYRKNRDLLNKWAVGVEHSVWSSVQINDFSEWVNWLSQNTDDFWYVESLWGTNIKLYWWRLFFPWEELLVEDTEFTLPNDWSTTIIVDIQDKNIKAIPSANFANYFAVSLAKIETQWWQIYSKEQTRWYNVALKWDSPDFEWDGTSIRFQKPDATRGDWINLKWDQWDAATLDVWTTTTWNPWTNANVVNAGTTSEAIFNFTIPRWDKWEKWDKWDKWDKGDKGDKWDQWIQGLKWDKGDKGDKWDKGDTWNWIYNITRTSWDWSPWTIDTYTITFTDTTTTTFQVYNWANWTWSITSVVWWTDITIDNTDPDNPIINHDWELFSTAEKNKLAWIEPNATADQTAWEIKTAYESNANTNAYTDAEKTKLTNIEAGAQVNTLNDVISWTNVTIDKTNPLNPIINSTATWWHTIQDEWISLTQRTKLNFVWGSVTVTDDPINDTSVVTITGGDLTPLPAYTIINDATDREIDLNNTTIEEIGNVLATHIRDTKEWIKGDTWDAWPQWVKGDTWPQWMQGIQWVKWDKWDKGDKWDQWIQGLKGDKGDTWPWVVAWWTAWQVLSKIDWTDYNTQWATLNIPDNADYVDLTTNQTVAWIKTFSSSPIVPTPTTNMQVATKKYVDDNAWGWGWVWFYYDNINHRLQDKTALQTKLNDDESGYLTTDWTYIFYKNWSDWGKIYRINIDWSWRLKLNDDESGYLTTDWTYIFYRNGSDWGKIYKSETNNIIYFTGVDSKYESEAIENQSQNIYIKSYQNIPLWTDYTFHLANGKFEDIVIPEWDENLFLMWSQLDYFGMDYNLGELFNIWDIIILYKTWESDIQVEISQVNWELTFTTDTGVSWGSWGIKSLTPDYEIIPNTSLDWKIKIDLLDLFWGMTNELYYKIELYSDISNTKTPIINTLELTK